MSPGHAPATVAAQAEAEAAAAAQAWQAAAPAPASGAVDERAPWTVDRGRWPAAMARRHRALLARQQHGGWLLLSDQAEDTRLLQAAEARLELPLAWYRIDSDAIDRALAQGEREGRALDVVSGVASQTGEAESSVRWGADELSLATLDGAGSPAVRLLDALLLDALRDSASDLHLEMTRDGAQPRVRIDGVLQPLRRIEGQALSEQMVSRLKVMAELDIGERRLPQDGRFKRRVQAREVDFRLSVMPGLWGEDAVIRVLDRGGLGASGSAPTLSELGFDADWRERLLRLARAPHGLLLVTGPTGSGKTTTLYAVIQETRTGGEKIITVEDPVEYQLPGVVQVPVNERKGLGFARGLRAMLRHDPDRVMVGEIRDAETATIALQAAMTGHLVYSSVHANGVFEVISRLGQMGLDVHDLVGALRGVMAQRLLRRLCDGCARPLGHGRRAAVGCAACRDTGYRGRQPVAELLALDDALRDALVARAPLGELRRLALARGHQPLRQMAQALVARGVTTDEEIDRVVGLD